MRSFDKDHIDATVCLNKGDHEFCTERLSYIYYRGAQIKQISELEAEKLAGQLKPHKPCKAEILGLVAIWFLVLPSTVQRLSDGFTTNLKLL